MPCKPENPGTCAYCGEVVTQRGVAKHLEVCLKRQKAVASAASSSRPVETLWHLRVQDAYDKDFWLDLEMTGSASLETLDEYLRAIWLECCDHLSQFTIGGWGGLEVGRVRKANSIFQPGLVLRHLYDFGTTSETDIKVVGLREGKATTRHPITLLARNRMPERLCMVCDQLAGWMCFECLYEADEPGMGFLCDEHVKGHPHDDLGDPIEVVNSPRLGMCGYEGPAEPPY